MRVLHIIGSPRGERSRSRAIAEHFSTSGGAEVERPRPVDDRASRARRRDARKPLPADQRPDVEPRSSRIGGAIAHMVDHLLSFDLWLFSTPMWNFGLPYRLKHYVDCVIQPTMAFTNDSTGARDLPWPGQDRGHDRRRRARHPARQLWPRSISLSHLAAMPAGLFRRCRVQCDPRHADVRERRAVEEAMRTRARRGGRAGAQT